MMSKDQAFIVSSEEEVLGLTQKWKKEGFRIVFTNGCFDIVHAGHVDYLQKAAKLGDKLMVGLNSDSSVKRLKGVNRPINEESQRTIVLAGLRAVDAVIVFQENTPINLIQIIEPDVLVKGGDYKGKEVVGAKEVKEKGGEVVLIDFVFSNSTSSLLKKLNK